MILVGLTGGIGSGKSTVSAMLAARGAEIVDADLITREVQRPGSAVVGAIVQRFGEDVIDEDGSLLRAKLAEIVFADGEALADLNAIVHPAVRAEIARSVDLLAPTYKVVVLDIPLLTERWRGAIQAKIVVDVPVKTQVERLVSSRGFAESDARARIARQTTREERLQGADFVIDNSGEMGDLEPQVDKLWEWLGSLPQLPQDFTFEHGLG
ncbi:MAG: dephospho-CoA kinase [Ilumatobacteraceae bacterium]|jgi:dephospho-CoA kinase